MPTVSCGTLEQQATPQTIRNSDKRGYKARVLSTLSEVESVRELWEKWQAHPNTDLDHFLLICRSRSNVHHPFIVLVEADGEPQALLVGRLEDGIVAPAIGYLKPVKIPVTKLTLVAQGLLGNANEGVAKVILGALLSALKDGKADLLEFHKNPTSSPVLQTALDSVPYAFRSIRTEGDHWGMKVPKEPGQLLKEMKSKHRSWIRRKMREVDDAFPGGAQYWAHPPGGDIGHLCSQIEPVARLTYQRKLGGNIVDDPEQRQRLDLFNKQSALRAWILQIDNKPKAFALGIVYKDTFHFSMTGYDAELRDFEVGTLLFLRMVDDLAREGVAQLDFGFGDAYYKRRFGDHSWPEMTLCLYARGPKGLLLRTGVGAMMKADKIARYLVARLGVIDRLKRAWRQALRPRARSEGEQVSQ